MSSCQQALDLIFYGDSITEKWREFGAVYKAHFAKYRSIVLAIPGMSFSEGHWRIQHGWTIASMKHGVTPQQGTAPSLVERVLSV